jgi:hypothetical protein
MFSGVQSVFQSKQQQVEELLTRADQLVTEQKDSEFFVYEAMAERCRLPKIILMFLCLVWELHGRI